MKTNESKNEAEKKGGEKSLTEDGGRSGVSWYLSIDVVEQDSISKQRGSG